MVNSGSHSQSAYSVLQLKNNYLLLPRRCPSVPDAVSSDSSGRRPPLHGRPGDSRLIGTVFSCPPLRWSSTTSRWTRGLTSDWHCLLVSSPQVVIHPFTVDQGLALNGSLLVLRPITVLLATGRTTVRCATGHLLPVSYTHLTLPTSVAV